jgi:hypothetical protein
MTFLGAAQDGFRAGRFHVARQTPLARPTTDLYFYNAMRDSVTRPLRAGRIQPIGLNSFRVDGCAVVLRQDSPDVIARVVNGGWRKVVYLVDDDIESGLVDQNLPSAYRARLRSQFERCARPMLAAADVVITGSERLALIHSAQRSAWRLDPYWGKAAGMGAPRRDRDPGRRFRIVYLGAQSHENDLEIVLPAVERFLRRYPDAEFVTFLDTPRLRRLAREVPVSIRPMTGWYRYRRWVGSEHFDLALYPTADSAFNQARSVNKLIEHALVGAVAVYSDCWEQTRRLEPGVNCLVASNDPQHWFDVLARAIGDRRALADLFDGALAMARELDRPTDQVETWNRVLAA